VDELGVKPNNIFYTGFRADINQGMHGVSRIKYPCLARNFTANDGHMPIARNVSAIPVSWKKMIAFDCKLHYKNKVQGDHLFVNHKIIVKDFSQGRLRT
jgi:hypothetical protein